MPSARRAIATVDSDSTRLDSTTMVRWFDGSMTYYGVSVFSLHRVVFVVAWCARVLTSDVI